MVGSNDNGNVDYKVIVVRLDKGYRKNGVYG